LDHSLKGDRPDYPVLDEREAHKKYDVGLPVKFMEQDRLLEQLCKCYAGGDKPPTEEGPTAVAWWNFRFGIVQRLLTHEFYPTFFREAISRMRQRGYDHVSRQLSNALYTRINSAPWKPSAAQMATVKDIPGVIDSWATAQTGVGEIPKLIKRTKEAAMVMQTGRYKVCSIVVEQVGMDAKLHIAILGEFGTVLESMEMSFLHRYIETMRRKEAIDAGKGGELASHQKINEFHQKDWADFKENILKWGVGAFAVVVNSKLSSDILRNLVRTFYGLDFMKIS
jgi:hypothetical protein